MMPLVKELCARQAFLFNVIEIHTIIRS